MTDADKPWTPEEAASWFSVSEVTIRRWVREGKLRRIPTGGALRITALSIQRLSRGECDQDGGASGVLKRTSGTTTLSAINSYTGQTRVQAGTLRLAGLGSLAAASSLLVEPGAVFDTDGGSQPFSRATNNGTVSLGGGMISVGSSEWMRATSSLASRSFGTIA